MRARLPRGRVRWAAVSPFMSKGSPLAVGLPCSSAPYQVARPTEAAPSHVAGTVGIVDIEAFPVHGLASATAIPRWPRSAKPASQRAPPLPLTGGEMTRVPVFRILILLPG